MDSIRSKARYALALPAVLAGSAYAAVPAEVTSALSDAKTDAVTVAGAVLVIAIALAAFIWMRRAAR